MNTYGSAVKSKEEVFVEENGFLIGNLLYSGKSTANGGMNVGYKVLSKDGKFQGLLDQGKIALWWTKEESLSLVY